ncbi:hypothetical protein [Pseudoruegeria sp. SK021]|uniref:hypothetical protein n=1 Tax=Pseudoruegeria sp. SK021 TaxID=1933035 RepID=UPI000A25636C|nr:hypothetical protein [Pseudoruegeria sp. SK021]OSP53645.1 hypothetical protein BV911_16880 [Pseudoruegeria sp. SK021]
MVDSTSHERGLRPLQAVSIGHLSREARWSLTTPRSYLVPVLFWFTGGQGRISVNGTLRGYTSHNAIFLPANTSHACEAMGRTQGTALFFGGRTELSGPSEMLHLRLSTIQQQTEMNQLVENFRQDCTSNLPLTDEVLYHRACLILLWLAQNSLRSGDQSRRAAPEPADIPAYRTRG